jgi:hypothetical protein
MIDGASFVRSPAALWRRVGAEIVMTRQGVDGFEQLSPTAAAVWALLDEPMGLQRVVELLTTTFAAPADAIGRDIRALFDRLVEGGYVETMEPPTDG